MFPKFKELNASFNCLCFYGPAFSNVRPHSMARLIFFVVVGKPFKKTVWSRHLFLFYFKGEKQNKKEKP